MTGMRYVILKAEFTAVAKVEFPPNPVNTFRGALGYKLQKTVCFQRARLEKTCRGCIGESSCVYARCFETGPAHLGCEVDIGMGTSSDVPHPMLLDAEFNGPCSIEPGQRFVFTVTLFGKAVESVPFFVHVFTELAASGLTRNKSRCELVSVVADSVGLIYDSELKVLNPLMPMILNLEEPEYRDDEHVGQVALHFETPVSFKDKAGGGVVNRPDFTRIIRSLLRRHTFLRATDGLPAPNWDYAAILKLSQRVKIIESNLELVRWERYSTRQEQRISWGGCVGIIRFAGPIRPFLPLLKAGEVIRVGRGTVFGQGRYKCITDSESAL